jgi:hypothetical protein
MTDMEKQRITTMFDPVVKSKRKRRPQFEFERKHIKIRPSHDIGYSGLYKCSLCTAGSAYCQLQPERVCTTCCVSIVSVCEQCREHSNELPTTCSVCTTRSHLCLSACGHGCTLYEKPTCDCKKGKGTLVRLQVKKLGDNHGRYFWSCRVCSFFAFEEDVLQQNDLDDVYMIECKRANDDAERKRQFAMTGRKEFPCNMCSSGVVRLDVCDYCSPSKQLPMDCRPHLKLLRLRDERLEANVGCNKCAYDMMHGDNCSYCM